MKKYSIDPRRTRAIKEQNDEKTLDDSIFDDLGFRWRCSASSHRWLTSRVLPYPPRLRLEASPPSRVITDAIPKGTEWLTKDSRPLLKQGLFIDFAYTEPTEERILAFANEWGLLGVHKVLIDPRDSEGLFDPPVITSKALFVFGELFQAWRISIVKMKEAVMLWEACKTEDLQTLSKFLSWRTLKKNGPPEWYYRALDRLEFDQKKPPYHARFILHHDDCIIPQPGLPEISSTDFVGAGKRFLQQIINVNLKDQTISRVTWHCVRKEYIIRILPRTLFGAIWWQFARAFTGEIQYRTCKVCSRPMEISEDGFRSDREFCSPACRQKDHRAKVIEAKKLHAEGVKVRAIAKQMNTTPETIQHWLQKKK